MSLRSPDLSYSVKIQHRAQPKYTALRISEISNSGGGLILAEVHTPDAVNRVYGACMGGIQYPHTGYLYRYFPNSDFKVVVCDIDKSHL